MSPRTEALGHLSDVELRDELARLDERSRDLTAELRARKRGDSALPDGDFDVLRFSVGEVKLALPLLEVVEVVRMARTSPIEGAAHHLLGALDLGGRSVPVVDTSLRFGAGRLAIVASALIVIARTDSRQVGLGVETLDGVERAGGVLESPDPASGEGQLVRAAWLAPDGRVLIPSVSALLGAGLPGGAESRPATRPA